MVRIHPQLSRQRISDMEGRAEILVDVCVQAGRVDMLSSSVYAV